MTRATAMRPHLDNDITVCISKEAHAVRLSIKHYGDRHYRHVYLRPNDAMTIGLKLAKCAINMSDEARKLLGPRE